MGPVEWIVVAVVILVIAAVTYNRLQNKESHPANVHWHNKAVLYGNLRWRTSGFDASNILLELKSFGYTGTTTVAATRSASNGYFEITRTSVPSGDLYVDAFRTTSDGTRQRVLDSVSITLRINSPKRLDRELNTPKERASLGSLSLRTGVVHVFGPSIEPRVRIQSDDGSSVTLRGPLVPEIQRLASTHIEAYGPTNQDSTMEVEEYVIVDPLLQGRLVGWLDVRNGTWFDDASGARRVSGGDWFVKGIDGFEEIRLAEVGPDERIRNYASESGPPAKMWMRGYREASGRLKRTRWGVLRDPGA